MLDYSWLLEEWCLGWAFCEEMEEELMVEIYDETTWLGDGRGGKRRFGKAICKVQHWSWVLNYVEPRQHSRRLQITLRVIEYI